MTAYDMHHRGNFDPTLLGWAGAAGSCVSTSRYMMHEVVRVHGSEGSTVHVYQKFSCVIPFCSDDTSEPRLICRKHLNWNPLLN